MYAIYIIARVYYRDTPVDVLLANWLIGSLKVSMACIQL